MSINNKDKSVVDALLTDDATTEAEFKTGLQDVTTELENLEDDILAMAIALG